MGPPPGQPAMGYGPPPGSLPGSFGDAASSAGGGRMRKVLPIVVLVIILIAGAAFTFMRMSASPVKMNVPPPVGWNSIIDDQTKNELDTKSQGAMQLDEMYSNNQPGNLITAIHGRILPKLPETKSLEEMQAYVDKNGSQIKSDIFFQGDVDISDFSTAELGDIAYEPVMLSCGYAGLRISGTMTMPPSTVHIQIDCYYLYRGSTGYMIVVYKPLGQDMSPEMDFLRENVTFAAK